MGRAVVLHKQMIAVAMLAMPWASEIQASSDQARPLADVQHATVARTFDSGEMADYGSFEVLPPGRGNNDRPVQVAQAAAGDAGRPREREHHWSETLSCELTTARRDIELLQRLEQERKRFARLEQDLVAARRDVEEQTALAEKASEEASRLKQVGKSGAADVQVSLQQERERSARLEQDLAAARRDLEAQAAMASSAADEILQRKQAAEAGVSELRQSIQKERERGDALANDLSMTRSAMYASEAQARRAGDEATKLREEIATIANGAPSVCKSVQDEHIRSEWLEQDLAAAHADAETQAALAAKAGEEASRLKQASESSEVELQKSVQQERERSARLEQDLAAARADAGTQTALAAKAGEEASRLKQARESSEVELQKSVQQERERSARLEQDLAAARADAGTQTALAAKAGEEASRLKQASESSEVELQKSVQQERERSARLEQDLAAARADAGTQTALAAKAGEEASRLKQARESSEVELQKSVQQERERSARLEQDLAAARADAGTQTALAAKAGEEASRLKQARESSETELQKSVQQERERSASLEQDLAGARADTKTQTALAVKASEEASRLKQASESSEAELQKSVQQERERSARLEQDLAAARADAGTQTALAVKAGEEASRLKQASESSEAELQKSVQQERERSARLEQDLAAARADAKTQTALAAKIADEVLRLKRTAQSEVAELKQSMQKERNKADALAQDLSLARSAVYAYEAQARKTGDQAAELRQAAANGAQPLRNSARDGRDRSTQLEQDLVTARRDLDTHAALVANASEEVARTRQAAERDSASLRSSLQRERARADQLERDLALAKQVAPNAVTVGSVAREKPAENARSVADRSPLPMAGVRSDAEPDSRKDTVAAALLARASALLRQGDIGAARIVLERAVEMGNVQASFSLAETYDPLILARWGTLGTRGDAVRAKDLYAKADAAGIKEAKARIEALRR